MLNLSVIYCGVLVVFQGALFVGYLKSFKQKNKQRLACDELDVIIPFRNEEDRLPGILSSILKQKKHPSKYIFVNDHSEDGSLSVINAQLQEKVNYTIVSSEENGKKMAIRSGLKESNSKWILTFDADVEFDEAYFLTLENTTLNSFNVLPVVMIGNSFKSVLFGADYNLSNYFNYAVSGYSRPVLASGANLLFKRSDFDEVDSILNHQNISSGDDMFLLKDFVQHQKTVGALVDESLSVRTSSPTSIAEYFSQRFRWFGKTAKVKDGLANGLGVLAALVQIYFLFILVFLVIEQNWLLFVGVIGFKSIVEMLFLRKFTNEFSLLKLWLLYPIVQFVIPITSLLILLGSKIAKPKWKGREIYSTQK